MRNKKIPNTPASMHIFQISLWTHFPMWPTPCIKDATSHPRDRNTHVQHWNFILLLLCLRGMLYLGSECAHNIYTYWSSFPASNDNIPIFYLMHLRTLKSYLRHHYLASCISKKYLRKLSLSIVWNLVYSWLYSQLSKRNNYDQNFSVTFLP